MSIDYKKELENASKSMIMVHKPDILIKMIVRTIVQKVQVRHAAILLHDQARDSYILTISRGDTGLKIPEGFARVDTDNPLIRVFRENKDKKIFSNGAVIYDEMKSLLGTSPQDVQNVLKGAISQMEMFETTACIPSYFRDDLLALLMLGNKNDGSSFAEEELDFFAALASDVAMAIRNAQLFRNLELELDNKQRLFINTTVALAAAIDAKDHYTHGHTSRVTEFSLAIAKKLASKNSMQLAPKFMENLHIASLLHDIGKIGVPENILNKQGPLDDYERKRMQEHPTIGVSILQPIQELQEPILGIKYHHERFDGSGYPEGLKADQIPLIAAIISVADTFDAMTTDRPYRKALSREEAVNEIKHLSGKQFNPLVTEALSELYQENKL